MKTPGTLVVARVLCKGWAMQLGASAAVLAKARRRNLGTELGVYAFVMAKARHRDWVLALCTWAEETLRDTCYFSSREGPDFASEEPVHIQVWEWESSKVA